MTFQILVTAALIERDGHYLITQRPDDGRHNANRWEFPGGKVDFGEDPRACLKREIEEELNIKVSVHDIFEVSSHVYDNEKHVILMAFSCKYKEGTIQNLDIKAHAWVKSHEFQNYDICEADLPFIDKLKSLSE
ncbi:(deoxy)nucleoside triphosphate pyrophosphohydrolase [Nanoarchaeota archaeon]